MKEKNKKIICYHLDGTPQEVNISELRFRPSVYGLLIKDGKILLSKQWDGYDFPGGGIDIDETIDQALEREFWEETGIKVKKDKLVSCESRFFIGIFSKKPFNSILMYYLCQKVGGQLSKDNFAGNEKDYLDMPEWINLKDIDKIKFYNSVDSPAIINKAFNILNKNE
ncbi:NUDIX domain-containing protein [Candidatus Falkowbacteria bacterium]|nr:NUDIX domain-containing protein [Candidatus Falkowbacteria bacterium]